MTDEKSSPLVPTLRFPEFSEAGEWMEKILREICDINPRNEELPESFFYIDLESVVAGELISKRKINKKDAPSRAQRLLRNGDVIYQTVRPYQRNNFFCNFNDGNNYVASTGYAQLRSFGASGFLYHLIHTDTFVKKVITKCTGSNYPAINSSDLAEIDVTIPLLPEQQKIAACLSSLDELITAHSKKLDALKKHKKGLMQQLFPAEGQTVPSLRFPEFSEAGEWEKCELGQKVVKIGSGITPNGGEKNYKSKGRPFVRSQNVGWGCLILDDIVFIDDIVHSTFSATEILEGDVFLNITGASIGRSAIADYRVKGGNVNQHVCIIRTANQSELNPFYLNQYLLSQYGQKQIDSFQAGGNRQGLNFAQIRSFSLPLPLIAEQQKIAACLSSLDEFITAHSKKLDALKKHKKGLMQQLFPAVGED